MDELAFRLHSAARPHKPSDGDCEGVRPKEPHKLMQELKAKRCPAKIHVSPEGEVTHQPCQPGVKAAKGMSMEQNKILAAMQRNKQGRSRINITKQARS